MVAFVVELPGILDTTLRICPEVTKLILDNERERFLVVTRDFLLICHVGED
jgi:hypothetical protein